MPDASTAVARRLALLAACALAACAPARPALAQDIPRVPRADAPGAAPRDTAGYVPRPIAADDLDAVRRDAATDAARAADPGGPPPRVTLVSRQRPVVLIRGGSRSGAVEVVEATVKIGADGQRSLVYSERAPTPTDIGAELGCGPAAERAVARLTTLAEDSLAPAAEGPLVGAAQQLLCVVGYGVAQDGAFSDDMALAVLALQQDTNAAAAEAGQEPPLVETGVLDPRTRRVLEDRARLRLGQ